MKICIAYDSKYGNGKKCAEYVQNAMIKKGHDAQAFYIRETKPKALPQADLYIFSAPTHIGGPPWKMKSFLKKLNVKTRNAKYSLITTYMDETTKVLPKMTALLQPHGLVKAADGIMIKVTGMKGPLEEGYTKKLDRFVDAVLR